MTKYTKLGTWKNLEIDLYNRLNRNRTHSQCDLIIKQPYKLFYHYALYCTNHDFFMGWIKYDDIDGYKKIGINTVIYAEDGINQTLDNLDLPLALKDHWAYEDMPNWSYRIPKTVKVNNLRSGKKTDLWVAYVNDTQHDPSMPEYWKFIDSFK